MIGFNRSECGFNSLVHVEAFLVHEAVQALAVNLQLDFGEDCFDRVEFRRITNVPNWKHVQLRPPLFDANLLVDACIVHEQ